MEALEEHSGAIGEEVKEETEVPGEVAMEETEVDGEVAIVVAAEDGVEEAEEEEEVVEEVEVGAAMALEDSRDLTHISYHFPSATLKNSELLTKLGAMASWPKITIKPSSIEFSSDPTFSISQSSCSPWKQRNRSRHADK